MTDLILAVFRLNGRLLAAGDRLVSDLGLTSARWQVLGAIAHAPTPQPVAWLARSMGLNRQGVQRLVNEMREDDLVELRPNPHHRRAHLVALTRRGQDAFAAASRLQAPWANALAKGVDAGDLAAARRIVKALSERLENAD
ncbi:MarR family winged helix-turn-helix transcriptional regulator [Bradyrhizobium sp. TZ2]